MQSDTWGSFAQQSNALSGRSQHQRDSSLSSISSTIGPASPFDHTHPTPRISLPDMRSDGIADLEDADGSDQNNFYSLMKTMNPYPGYPKLEPALTDMAYPITLPSPVNTLRNTRGFLPGPDMAPSSPRQSSTPMMSSSLTDTLPQTMQSSDVDAARRRKGFEESVPKLSRTMTDVYGDELYNPNFAITSTPSSQTQSTTSTGTNELFKDRLNLANNQHLSASQLPPSMDSRDKSPFRTGSELAPASHLKANMAALSTPAQLGQQNLSGLNEQQLSVQPMTGAGREPETPKTISPKDAILELNDSDCDNNFPLFPSEPSVSYEIDAMAKNMASRPQALDLTQQMLSDQAIQDLANNTALLPNSMHPLMQMHNPYPLFGRNQSSNGTPPRLSSAGSSASEFDNDAMTPVIRRPKDTTADGGTYTCTYHGCTLRFATPALLQKHKREGHRQAQGLGVPHDGAMPGLAGSQAGPHRCDRINPSTGKPCNTVFSRPYDLTRHEDTIHNARKRKVRCDLCTEEKTFSRADALTRHYRVCHPDMELPGKQKRRGGD